MPSVVNITGQFRLDTRQAELQLRKLEVAAKKAAGGASFKSANIGARELENTIGRTTNRVVALATSLATLGAVQKTFSQLVSSTIEVEQSLARINVNLNQGATALKSFSQGLFNVARDTGQSFETAAKAAEEFARQGLGAEETTKRVRDALILSRIANIDAVTAVETLTAAYNTFRKEGLTTTDIINKLVAVDTKFAVSSSDLAEGISRVGSTAQDAGVQFDELLAIITSVQQKTQRGGAVISDAFKTIFTRVQNPETLNQLEQIGVSIKDTEGRTLPAIRILQNLSDVYGNLSQSQQNVISKEVAGTYQINVLKAALGALSKEYGEYNRVRKESANATDQAIQKNAQLNQTLASSINATKASIEQLFSSIGSQNAGPFINGLLKSFDEVRKYLSGDTGDKLGESLGDGILKGLSNVITGPGLVAVTVVLGRAFGKVLTTVRGEIQNLLGINNASIKRAEIQTRINALLDAATSKENAQVVAATNLLERKEALLAISARLAREELLGTPLQNSFLSKNVTGGYKVSSELRGKIPNFANPISDAVGRELAAGVPSSKIYIDKDPRLSSAGNPHGLLVANSRDEPLGGFQGVNRVIAAGGNPKVSGTTPNFALSGRDLPFVPKKVLDEINKLLTSAESQTSKTGVSSELSKVTEKFVLSDKLSQQNSKRVAQETSRIYQERVDLERKLEISRLKSAKRSASFVAQDERLADLRERLQKSAESTAQKRKTISEQRQSGLKAYPSPIGPRDPGLSNIRNKILNNGIPLSNTSSTPYIPYSSQNYPASQRSANYTSTIGSGLLQIKNPKPTQAQIDALQKAEDLKEIAKQKRRDRLNTISFGVAIAAPFAAGFIPDADRNAGPGERALTGAAKGGLEGAGIGGIFGPEGVVAGAAIGALVGAVTKANKSIEEFGQDLQEAVSAREQENDAITRAVQLQQQLNEAKEGGSSQTSINKIASQLREARLGVSGVRGRAIINEPDEKKREILIAQNEDATEKQNRSGLITQQAKVLNDQKGIFAKFSDFFEGLSKDSKSTGNSAVSVAGSSIEKFISISAKGYDLLSQKIFGEGNLDEQTKAITLSLSQSLRGQDLSKIDGRQLSRNAGEDNPSIEQELDLSKLFSSLGETVEVTDINFKQLSYGLLKALKFIHAETTDEKKNLPNQRPPGLGDSFTNAPNLDVFTNAAYAPRNPAANRYQKAETSYEYYGELERQGAVKPEGLIGNKDYEQSKALYQTKNLLESAAAFITAPGSGRYIGQFQNSRGELSGKGLQLSAQQTAETYGFQFNEKGEISREGLERGRKYAFFASEIQKSFNSLKNAGVNIIGPQSNPSLIEATSGSTPGSGYSATTGQTAYDRTNFVTKNAFSKYGSHRNAGLSPNRRGPSEEQTTSNVTDDQADRVKADIDEAVKLINQAREAAVQVAQVIANNSIDINVTVRGIDDAANSQVLVAAIQGALQKLGVPIPKPSVPTRVYQPASAYPGAQP